MAVSKKGQKNGVVLITDDYNPKDIYEMVGRLRKILEDPRFTEERLKDSFPLPSRGKLTIIPTTANGRLVSYIVRGSDFFKTTTIELYTDYIATPNQPGPTFPVIKVKTTLAGNIRDTKFVIPFPNGVKRFPIYATAMKDGKALAYARLDNY